jgi:hypothetical protein
MGFAVNRRHGWLMTPTFKVFLEGRGFFMRLGPRESHVPESFFLRIIDTDEAVRLKLEQQKTNAGKS